MVGGALLPILSGAFLAIHYVGHPQVQDSVPTLAYVLLPLGLISSALGKRLYEGTWIDSLKDCISTSPLLDLPTLVGQLCTPCPGSRSVPTRLGSY